MTNKVTSLTDAVAAFRDGDRISLGGSFLQRNPAAVVRELARQGRRRLELVKPSPGYDLDLLCAAGVVDTVQCGIVSFDEPHGIASNYRHAVEQGRVKLVEHACITVASGLRAAAQNIPFMPLPEVALSGSDIPAASGFLTVTDPYTNQRNLAIPRIDVDWAVIHTTEADERGNVRLPGGYFWDPLVARAARHVLVTTESIVPTEEFAREPRLTAISEIYVDAVVEIPRGAAPTGCEPCYDTDHDAIRVYRESVIHGRGLEEHLEAMAAVDHGTRESATR